MGNIEKRYFIIKFLLNELRLEYLKLPLQLSAFNGLKWQNLVSDNAILSRYLIS